MSYCDFAIVFDLDGVLHRGESPISGVDTSLKLLRNQKPSIPHIFLTNSGGKTPETKAKHIHKITGIEIDPEHLILAHSPLVDKIEELGDSHILTVSKDSTNTTDIMKSIGFNNFTTIQEFASNYPHLYPSKVYSHKVPKKHIAPISAIFILQAPSDWGEAMQIIVDIIRTGGDVSSDIVMKKQTIPVFLANPDFRYASSYKHPRITSGAFYFCLQELYKKEMQQDLKYQLYGKPLMVTYDFATKVLNQIVQSLENIDSPGSSRESNIKTIYAIGDNPLSDIKGANSMGWFSILTRTGCFQPMDGKENDRENPADYVCDSVVVITEAIDFILKREKRI